MIGASRYFLGGRIFLSASFQLPFSSARNVKRTLIEGQQLASSGPSSFPSKMSESVVLPMTWSISLTGHPNQTNSLNLFYEFAHPLHNLFIFHKKKIPADHLFVSREIHLELEIF